MERKYMLQNVERGTYYNVLHFTVIDYWVSTFASWYCLISSAIKLGIIYDEEDILSFSDWTQSRWWHGGDKWGHVA